MSTLRARRFKATQALKSLPVSTPIYRAIMMAIEARRLELGFSMATVNDLAGTQDGYLAKMLYPDTPSGRQARWETVQLVVEALFGRDFTVQIVPGNYTMRSAPSIDKGASNKSLQIRHWRHRKHFVDLGTLGAAARNSKLSQEQRTRSARKAAKTRWKRIREARRRGEAHKAANADI